MNRPSVKLALAAVAALALIVVLALWLPSLVPAPAPEPTPTPTPTVELTVPEDPDHEHSDDTGGHTDYAPPGTCIDAGGGETICVDEVSSLSGDAALAALAQHRERVETFVRAFLTFDSGEPADARAARIQAAGGSADIAGEVTEVSRPDSTLVGLTAVTSVRDVGLIVVVDRDERGYRFNVPVNVTGSYRQAGGSGTDRVIGGLVTVWVDPVSGTVTAVEEDFPTVDAMR